MLGNFAILALILFGFLIKTIFFGKLRVEEGLVRAWASFAKFVCARWQALTHARVFSCTAVCVCDCV